MLHRFAERGQLVAHLCRPKKIPGGYKKTIKKLFRRQDEEAGIGWNSPHGPDEVSGG